MLTALLVTSAITVVLACCVGLIIGLIEDTQDGHEAFWNILLWPLRLLAVIRGTKKETEKMGTAYSRLEKQWEAAILKEAGLLIKTGMHPHDAVKSILAEKYTHSQLMLGEGNCQVMPMSVDKMYNRITGNGYY